LNPFLVVIAQRKPSAPFPDNVTNKIPCFYTRASSPTPGALIACSYKDLNSLKEDKCNDNLQNSPQSQDISIDHKKETIKELIDSICKYQKNYVKNSLSNL